MHLDKKHYAKVKKKFKKKKISKKKKIFKKKIFNKKKFIFIYKNMCNNCYHNIGRNRKAWKCEHKNKIHYALGICQTCYHYKYSKKRNHVKKNKIIIKENSIVNNSNEINNLNNNKRHIIFQTETVSK